MTAHDCKTFDPNCYRCDLAQDEVEPRSPYPPSRDRIYPRCPECRTEQYALAVLAFSRGECACYRCGHVIREDARLDAPNAGSSDLTGGL
jgi:hypothetical protein